MGYHGRGGDQHAELPRGGRQGRGDSVRPITLYQAQARDKDDPTVITADKLREHLIQNEGIDPAHIAVATGDERGIEGVNLFEPSCPIRHIITVQALKEGWDCSFAYVFCSIQELKSARAVEQLLGRVLRMPYAKERPSALLNKAYAHVSSRDFAETASALKDCLVDRMGFERIEADAWTEAADFFPGEGSGAIVGLAPDGRSISVPAYAPLDFGLFAAETGLVVENAGTRSDGVPLVRVSGSITEAAIGRLRRPSGPIPAASARGRSRAISPITASFKPRGIASFLQGPKSSRSAPSFPGMKSQASSFPSMRDGSPTAAVSTSRTRRASRPPSA